MCAFRTRYYLLVSHFWFATVQLVLQADWQDVWHSPQPPFLTLFDSAAPAKVLICFILFPPLTNILKHYTIGFCHLQLLFPLFRSNPDHSAQNRGKQAHYYKENVKIPKGHAIKYKVADKKKQNHEDCA